MNRNDNGAMDKMNEDEQKLVEILDREIPRMN